MDNKRDITLGKKLHICEECIIENKISANSLLVKGCCAICGEHNYICSIGIQNLNKQLIILGKTK